MADRPADAGGSLKTLWFASPLYKLMLSGKVPQAFVAVPPDPWPGDGLRGNAMLAGEFTGGGRKRAIEGDPWAQSDAPPEWLAELHSFAWLRDLKEVGGEEPARFAAAMLDGWMVANTRVAGVAWSLAALRSALRSGDAQYYFHPYEMGPRPGIPLSLRERVFLRRLGPWMEGAVERIVVRLKHWGVRFVTAGELAESLRG